MLNFPGMPPLPPVPYPPYPAGDALAPIPSGMPPKPAWPCTASQNEEQTLLDRVETRDRSAGTESLISKLIKVLSEMKNAGR